MRRKNNKKWLLLAAGGGFIFLILSLVLIFRMMGKTVQLRSDGAGVKFVTEGEIITCVNIKGQFPYLSVVPRSAEKCTIDAEGNITEVYIIEAEFSLNQRNSMKLDIETSEEVTYKYILKFADRDVTILNGKEVEK